MSFNCTGAIPSTCVDPGDGSGTYATLPDCEALCGGDGTSCANAIHNPNGNAALPAFGGGPVWFYLGVVNNGQTINFNTSNFVGACENFQIGFVIGPDCGSATGFYGNTHAVVDAPFLDSPVAPSTNNVWVAIESLDFDCTFDFSWTVI